MVRHSPAVRTFCMFSLCTFLIYTVVLLTAVEGQKGKSHTCASSLVISARYDEGVGAVDFRLSKRWEKLKGDQLFLLRQELESGNVIIKDDSNKVYVYNPATKTAQLVRWPQVSPDGIKVGRERIEGIDCDIWVATFGKDRVIQWWARNKPFSSPIAVIMFSPPKGKPKTLQIEHHKNIQFHKDLPDSMFTLPPDVKIGEVPRPETPQQREISIEKTPCVSYTLVRVVYNEESLGERGESANSEVSLTKVWKKGDKSREEDESGSITIVNGAAGETYLYHPEKKTAEKLVLSPHFRELMESRMGGAGLSATEVGEEVVEGVPCKIVARRLDGKMEWREWKAKDEAVAKALGSPVRLVITPEYTGSSRKIVIQQLKNVEFHETLPDELFQLPPGTKVRNRAVKTSAIKP